MTIPQTTPANKAQSHPQTGGIPITVTVNGKPRTAGYAMPNHAWYRRMERSDGTKVEPIHERRTQPAETERGAAQMNLFQAVTE